MGSSVWHGILVAAALPLRDDLSKFANVFTPATGETLKFDD